MNWYLAVIKQYAVFSGRSRRQEYWMFTLINVIVSIVLRVVDEIVGSPGAIQGIYAIALFLPSLGVAIRRLHDTGHSAWWIFIPLVPIIGVIIMIIFLAKDSEPGENRYGPNPKAEMA
ncbi:MAG: hypothetical protein CMJ45_07625 [Planctomyces sp.]|jgi:uncharacterized membrane protein YhaH (DUF805 family)|nr:hypothetical protein [Planctomyces sp.]|tara:strand:+ start:174 stop:527 length:354 start_codon:yes stop_codon:yes gene_type:complete